MPLELYSVRKEEAIMNFIKITLSLLLISFIVNINANSLLSNDLDFYGHTLHVKYDQQLASLKLYLYDQREITVKL
jgi:hypothetical protein